MKIPSAIKQNKVCAACGQDKWYVLPDPSPAKSVTTSGVSVDQSLGKSQCCNCGMVQRNGHVYLGLTDFYEKSYTNYYARPGQHVFNKSRYEELADWVAKALGNFIPGSILEVGCGIGWTMREVQKKYPNARMKGVEPSEANSALARESGLDVISAKMEKGVLAGEKFDLIFSNHVLQHTTDPVAFIQACADLMSDNGLLVLTIQDARIPHSELLYSDQNFSFLPTNLLQLAGNAGLEVVSWRQAPSTDALFYSQLVVYAKAGADRSQWNIADESQTLRAWNQNDLDFLFLKRHEYLSAWGMIEKFLVWKTSKNKRVINFGAGLYSYLLECYAPAYWDKVDCCTIDGVDGKFLGKEVIPFEKLELQGEDCVVLGTRPFTHAFLDNKMNSRTEVIRWDNFISG